MVDVPDSDAPDSDGPASDGGLFSFDLRRAEIWGLATAAPLLVIYPVMRWADDNLAPVCVAADHADYYCRFTTVAVSSFGVLALAPLVVHGILWLRGDGPRRPHPLLTWLSAFVWLLITMIGVDLVTRSAVEPPDVLSPSFLTVLMTAFGLGFGAALATTLRPRRPRTRLMRGLTVALPATLLLYAFVDINTRAEIEANVTSHAFSEVRDAAIWTARDVNSDAALFEESLSWEWLRTPPGLALGRLDEFEEAVGPLYDIAYGQGLRWQLAHLHEQANERRRFHPRGYQSRGALLSGGRRAVELRLRRGRHAPVECKRAARRCSPR